MFCCRHCQTLALPAQKEQRFSWHVPTYLCCNKYTSNFLIGLSLQNDSACNLIKHFSYTNAQQFLFLSRYFVFDFNYVHCFRLISTSSAIELWISIRTSSNVYSNQFDALDKCELLLLTFKIP